MPAATDVALARAIGELGPGDCLIVTKLDSLARSLKDLLNTLDQVAKAGAGFRVLDTPALDTTTPKRAFVPDYDFENDVWPP